MTRLERYIAIATLKALLLVSAGLTILFSLLEFLNQLHDVGKGNYRLIDAVCLRAADRAGPAAAAHARRHVIRLPVRSGCSGDAHRVDGDACKRHLPDPRLSAPCSNWR